jgi:hypothetical protein
VERVPIKTKLFELNDDTKVWVRQASGLEKLKVEAAHAKALRKCRHLGPDPTKWTEEQQDEFFDLVEGFGGGLEGQISHLIPLCVGDLEDGTPCDHTLLMSEEIVVMLPFIRGDEEEGAIPLVR